MSWVGGYWGLGGAIDQAEGRFANSQKKSGDMVALASVHYSALGTAWIRLKRGRFWYILRAVSSARRALQLANTAFDQGRQHLTADNIDVLCCIWWRLHRQNQRATLALMLPAIMQDQSPHTAAFILMHQVRFGQLKLTECVIGNILGYAEATAGDNEVAQAARVYRQLYDLVPGTHQNRAGWRERAEQLARAAGATDQLEKLGVLVE